MKKKFVVIILGIMLFSIILSGCSVNDTGENNLEARLKEKDEKINELEKKIKELESNQQDVDSSHDLISRTIEAISLIKDKDMNSLSNYIHPTKGVRFTPYPNVDIEKDQVFTSEELSTALDSSEVYMWGIYDGSGEDIKLSFKDYCDRFIYDEDFANPQLIGNNIIIGEGNTIENVVEAYPNSRFIELYFSGINPEYAGIDWRSLKLVFEEYEDNWYLVGIIHGEWTV